ncbi:hypothetical protein DCAR_0414464 [Daucus carota subsp. sativus]|uniref:Uncharacterized protein n=1 Tax=Daucus carota subsp. sativus TaxID=79200 RepID=A0AAF1AWN1_DAUCS|nr:hypothetical protein DCAR_0414464 [Daucus carota subsp. sativus]
MALSSCDEADSSYPQFNENADMEDPKFRLAMVFSSGQAFRDVVRKHAIVHQRPVRLKKNQIERCNINDSMIYRALRKAKMVIQGKHEDEFKKLYDYGNELLKAMPTSTVKVMTETAMSGTDAVTFKRFLSV